MKPVSTLFALALLWSAASPAQTSEVLDSFDDLAPWQALHTDDVQASLHAASGKIGAALQLDFDFTDAQGHPINGYATAHRSLPLDLPDNYELRFWVRGDAPVNTLQFKLIDASGENVWWLNRPDFAVSHDWQPISIKKRQLEFAWGPTADRVLQHSASIEFVISSGREGGKGSMQFDQLELRALPPDDTSPLVARATATSSAKGAPAAAAVDGNPNTVWRSDAARGAEQHLDLDFGTPREFGGLLLHWQPGEAATDFDIDFSDDGQQWRTVRRVRRGGLEDAPLLLTESQSRFVRIALHAGQARSYALREVQFEDLAWGATPNAMFSALAKDAPRGTYPRGFVEQPYWTLVGVDGGSAPALISEDGAVEPARGSYSVEPFLVVDGKLSTWADVRATQTLRDDYLPMPHVVWAADPVQLDIAAFARGTREQSQLVTTYRVRNASDRARTVTLALAIRPFQVNPPAQFLNAPGGVSPIRDLAWNGRVVAVNGTDQVLPLPAPDRFIASSFDAGSAVDTLRRGAQLPAAEALHALHDEVGYASAVLVYNFTLPAGGERVVVALAPITGALVEPDLGGRDAPAWAGAEAERVAAAWRDKLDRVRITLPPAGKRIADALRTAQAHILITRDGAALRPGTRSYARSWVRDGAMIADGLLRLGDVAAARDYVDWYAPHQFASGKVPCCVDHRGSDPVPENDSHGELIHAIAQLYRYGGDRAELARNWAHVQAAVAYMDGLRASETGAANPAFKGLMPASISHEGYSAKPMHSYWDDFWALTGYKDAVYVAKALDKRDAAARMAASRDEFAHDLYASIARAVKQHAIDFIPGCAELGDFDATSTTVALSPADEQSHLPPALLRTTFERYWHNFSERRDLANWDDYTPYEWRTVGTFVRLGWRDRAQQAVEFFFSSGARPAGWNQWAEVVGRDPRRIRFIGDMPHGWVASDFIRSALDLFAYARDADQALIVAGGVPTSWLSGAGVELDGLHTPYGKLGYSLRRIDGAVHLHIQAGIAPPGGIVFAWPGEGKPGPTRIDGKQARWHNGELRIPFAPADVVIEESSM